MTTSDDSQGSSSADSAGAQAGPLAGRGAVITGGGRGIGEGVARRLAADGAAVVVSARSKDQVEKVAEELREAGHSAWGIPCDVTDPEQIANLFTESEKVLGTVDILVNNAGIASSAPVTRTSLEEWEKIFAVNVTGVFLCTRHALGPMVERGWGRIVNMASVAGKMGGPYISAYTASKHAVVGFTRSLGVEIAKTGVTANAVCPGYVETEMAELAVTRITTNTKLDADAARQSLEAMSPQGRIFAVEEVAHLVASVCHPHAAGVNAQSLVLDGGAFQA